MAELGEATNTIDVVVPTPPRYVRGADGKIHLEYDLVITDVMSAPVGLTSLVVRNGDAELARLDADALKAVTFQFLSPTPTLDIAPRPPSPASSTPSCPPTTTPTCRSR